MLAAKKRGGQKTCRKKEEKKRICGVLFLFFRLGGMRRQGSQEGGEGKRKKKRWPEICPPRPRNWGGKRASGWGEEKGASRVHFATDSSGGRILRMTLTGEREKGKGREVRPLTFDDFFSEREGEREGKRKMREEKKKKGGEGGGRRPANPS